MLFVICILCAALALWLAATLFLWHRELLEIQKALEDIGAGNLNRRIVTRGPQAIRSIGYGINKIVQQSQQSAIQQKRHEQAYKQLITNLSHDIKTPLASLTGYLEAVENGLVVGQEKEEYLQTAYERAGALRSFVEKLFEWVKLDAGEQKLQIEPLDLCEISRQYMAEWIGPLESSGFSYTIEIPEETWLADLDKNAYKRIVNNLCENVLRHSHGTQFRFCLIPDARQATIRVSDNGTGISADDLPHVFDRLYQCDPSRTTPRKRSWPFHYQGTGRCYGRHHSGTKFSGPRNDIHHLFSESKSVAIKQRFFCRRAFLLPAFFLPLLKQPLSLFRLVKRLDLGQQEPGEALQLLLGYAVLPVLSGRRCL